MRTSSLVLSVSLLGLAALAGCAGSETTAPPPSNACTACHGDGTRNDTALNQAAPPLDAHGNSSTSVVTVGAHQAHLANNVPCATCHVVPPAGDTTHYAAPYATVIFSGNLVGANGATVAPWNRDVPTCANYCHGGTFPTAATPNPSWTRQTPLGCGDCHSAQDTLATATGLHYFHVVTTQVACSACHGAGYAPTSVTGTAVATHHDGIIQLTPAVGWQDPVCGTQPRLCNGACHNPPPTYCYYWP
jgi:predicted CxxxxCH...CXXCH cytochrome family protein